MSVDEAVSLSIGAFPSGVLYGSIAVGLVLVFRVAGTVNLAQGDIYVFGALTYAALSTNGWPVLVALIGVLFVGGGIGYVEDRLMLRRLLSSPPPIRLLATVGFAGTLAGLGYVLYGADPRGGTPILKGSTSVRGTSLDAQLVLLVVVFLAAAVATWLYFQRSATGRAITAVSQDADAARMMGIPVLKLRSISFATAGAIGAVTGALAVPLLFADFTQGLSLALRGFVVMALVGGQNILAAAILGLALAQVEAYGAFLITTSFVDVVTFALLVAVVLSAPKISYLRAFAAES